jgi:hypothetical protein
MRFLRNLLILSTLVTAVGVADAHPVRGGGYARGGAGYVSRPVYRGGGYARGGYVAPRSYGRSYGYGYGGYARRPIYMRAPVIREHYYSYYRRPSLIVENYAAMDGYVWVRGQWMWNGYEWIWSPGHYQPIW